MRITAIDHYVLQVEDVERSLAWYRDVLGLQPERLEEWRAGEAPFPSLRISEISLIDLIAAPRTGENVNHVALVVEDGRAGREYRVAAVDIDGHHGKAEPLCARVLDKSAKIIARGALGYKMIGGANAGGAEVRDIWRATVRAGRNQGERTVRFWMPAGCASAEQSRTDNRQCPRPDAH